MPYADAAAFLVTSQDGRLSLFASTGPRVWSTPWSLASAHVAPLAADLDGDGLRECVWAAPGTRLQLLGLDGQRPARDTRAAAFAPG
jgi:NAD-dependent oxidoreductase involved in siderophore biosynthesis